MKCFSLLCLGLLSVPGWSELRVEKSSLRDGSQTVLSWSAPVVSSEGASFAPPQLSVQTPRSNVMVASVDCERAISRAEDGVRVELQLPQFARGMSMYRLKRYWTSPVFTSDYRNLAGDSLLLVWQQSGDKKFHVLAPLVGDEMVASLGVRDHRFGVQASSFRAGVVPHRIPLFVYASDADPYRAMQAAYSATLPASNLRWNKPYPEAFRKLGWCSWNAFYQEVDRDKILAAAGWIRQNNIPVRTLLIDDGWMTTRGRKLSGWDATPDKFPGGLAPLVDELKSRGFEFVGVWHTLQGYWEGVVPDSEAGQGQQLFHGNEGFSIPDPRGTGFFHDWYARLKQDGIDFVKVDNQGGTYRFTDGLLPRVQANGGLQAELQQAVRANFGHAVINCMELTLENVYRWNVSNVARSSDDYLPENPTNSAEHVLHNAYNSAWLANFAYPDWDMFESGAPDGEFHAVARALSGGPVYCTDRPGKGNPRILKRLALSDGTVLRPDAPARVPAGMLLRDPSLEPIALQLVGEVQRPGYRAELMGYFNVNKSGRAIPLTVKKTGHRWSTRKTLPPLACEIQTVVRPTHGLALYGLLDKYLGAAAVHSVSWKGNACTIQLAEGGRTGLTVPHRPRQVEANGKSLPYRMEGDFLELDAPARFTVHL